MVQLGGHAIYLTDDVVLGARESVRDVARNLERFVDGIVVRTGPHEVAVELAGPGGHPGHQRPDPPRAPVPGARRRVHDARAIRAPRGPRRRLRRRRQQRLPLAGPARRRARDGGPPRPSGRLRARTSGSSPAREELAAASGGRLVFGDDPREIVRGAAVVYTDAWTSMGQEAETEERRDAFAGLPGRRRPARRGRSRRARRCTACRPTAARRSRPRSWTDRVVSSGNSPRTGCTSRRGSWSSCSGRRIGLERSPLRAVQGRPPARPRGRPAWPARRGGGGLSRGCPDRPGSGAAVRRPRWCPRSARSDGRSAGRLRRGPRAGSDRRRRDAGPGRRARRGRTSFGGGRPARPPGGRSSSARAAWPTPATSRGARSSSPNRADVAARSRAWSPGCGSAAPGDSAAAEALERALGGARRRSRRRPARQRARRGRERRADRRRRRAATSASPRIRRS